MVRPEQDQEYLQYCREAVERQRRNLVWNEKVVSIMLRAAALAAPFALTSVLIIALATPRAAYGTIVLAVFVLSGATTFFSLLQALTCSGGIKNKDLCDADIIANECAPYSEWLERLCPSVKITRSLERAKVSQRVAAAL